MEIFLTVLTGSIVALTVVGTYRYKFKPASLGQDEPATVSLLMPARNETHMVSRALKNALAIDYPKLEIIVLDDESQDNTSEKIRSFAQEGVRFIEGKPLPKGWIGKNWACHQLSEAASGDYMVFCDMDVSLTKDSLKPLINYMQVNDIAGMSLQPKLIMSNLWGAGFVPILYWLNLVMPKVNGFYPAYGGLMIFESQAYRQHGGFNMYPGEVLPEFKLAHDFLSLGGFKFFINDFSLNIYLYKKISSLGETRRRYLSHLYQTRPLVSILHAVLVLLPILLLAMNWWLYIALVLIFANGLRQQASIWMASAAVLPVVCVYEMVCLLGSVYSRVLNTNYWKNRQL